MKTKRNWQEYSAEEKLLIIESYLEGVAKLDSQDPDVQAKHLEWLREHLPAYHGKDQSYVFISYSHKNYRDVYHDLSFFLYNSETRLRFWYDEGLPAGSDWSRAASERIADPYCAGVIFYLSEAFLKSPAVREEIAMLKASGKPFVTVALEEGRYSARAILTDPADQALLSTLDEIFPDENTALRYEKDYENILYRIHKIESVFNVTENVMSDFICEERPDGLALVDYIGNKTEVYIPEKIGNSEIVEISAAFPNAATLFIPKTVKRILPSPIPEDTYEDLEALETTSYFRMMEASFGGFAETPRLFGTPSQLAAIYVDNDNPYFYDRNGVLYSRDNTLLRFPPNCPHTEGVLDGVVKIGDGAFADCNVLLDFDFPDTVEAIGDGAFANTSFQLMELGSSLKTVGASAFNEAATNMLFFLPDSVHTLGDWTYRNLRTPGDLSANFLFSNVETIPRGACFGADIRTVLFSGMPKHIEDGAFALCSQLQSMELQEGVLTIGDRAFVGCAKMTHIILPKSLVHIGEDAFLDCDKLKVIRYMGTTMQFLQLYLENPFLSDEQLSLVVCNNQPFRRLSAFRLLKKIEKARALLDD